MSKILIASFVILLFSCNSSENRPVDQDNIPTPLQDDKNEISLSYSKRGPEDLVSELYYDHVKKTKALENFEKEIEQLGRLKADSTETLYGFMNKNNSFYSTSDIYINKIEDSMLKKYIKEIINSSNKRYEQNIASLKNADSLLTNKSLLLNDYHNILKLSVSLSLIEKYQKENVPSPVGIEKVIKDYDKAIKSANELSTKKY